jgi:hypothetical protein
MNYEDDDTDFGIGDSMDGAGRSPESYQERPVSERRMFEQGLYCPKCGGQMAVVDVRMTREWVEGKGRKRWI